MYLKCSACYCYTFSFYEEKRKHLVLRPKEKFGSDVNVGWLFLQFESLPSNSDDNL